MSGNFFSLPAGIGNPSSYSNVGTYGYGGTYPTNFQPVTGPGLTPVPIDQFGHTGLDWGSPTALGYSLATGHSPGLGTNPYTFPGISGSSGGGDPLAGVSDFFGSLSSGAKLILLGGLGFVVLSYALKFRAR